MRGKISQFLHAMAPPADTKGSTLRRLPLLLVVLLALHQLQAQEFVANVGQWPEQVLFRTHACQPELWITEQGFVTDLRNEKLGSAAAMHYSFVAGRFQSAEGQQPLPGRYNYLQGDRVRGLSPRYRRVLLRNVYPDIDMVWYFEEGKARYDLLVHPGANPSSIRMNITGAATAGVTLAGDLQLASEAGTLQQRGLRAYQLDANRNQLEIKCCFKIDESRSPITVAFECGDYDKKRTLVIDPLVYSSYLGGADRDEILAMSIDSQGYTYVAGVTNSAQFPTVPGSYDTDGKGDRSAFVSKLSQDGSTLIWSTFLGGGADDQANAIALGPDNDVFVAGMTKSTDFPSTARFGRELERSIAFVARLSADGGSLRYGVLFGGEKDDVISAVTVDPSGNAYVTGSTSSDEYFPLRNAFDSDYNGGIDAFLLALNPAGDALLFASYLGGNGHDAGQDVSLSAEGSVILCGNTESENFPATVGTPINDSDAFLAVFDPDGSRRLIRLFGGEKDDVPLALIEGKDKDIYVAGYTASDDFPVTPGSYGQNPVGKDDAFVARIDRAGEILFARRLGGIERDYATAIDLDKSGGIFLSGATESSSFPISDNAPWPDWRGGRDAFVAHLHPDSSALLFATFIGGSDDDEAVAVAVDDQSNIYVAGSSESDDFPTTDNVLLPLFQQDRDGFITKFSIDAVARRPLLRVSAADLDFGTVSLGEKLVERVAISNVGNAPALLQKLSFSDNDENAFSDIFGSELPITIEPGTEYSAAFGFHPLSEGPKTAALTISGTANPILLRLKGSATEDDGSRDSAIVALPALEAASGDTVLLPLRILRIPASFDQRSATGFRAEFHFNASLLTPLDPALRGQINDGRQHIVIEGVYLGGSSNDVLAELPMICGLGDAEQSELILDCSSIRWEVDGSTIDQANVCRDGSFRLTDIWRFREDRLVNSNKGNLALDIQPNPVGDAATIQARISSAPAHLRLHDALGRPLIDLSDRLPAAAGNLRFTFVTAGLASGTYYLRLTSGTFVLLRVMQVK